MDEAQVDKLGSRMRDIYEDVAAVPVESEPVPKHPSRRLRKTRYVTQIAARSGRSPATRPGSASGMAPGMVAQRPLVALLAVAALGYLAVRLSR